jgi:hypothetical protein
VTKLPYLVAEINAALEVYLSARTGQQYNRVAFILCDDGAELASKLFLLTDTSTWSDRRANGSFKSFRDVGSEVRAVFSAKRPHDHSAADAVLKRIQDRRERRNKFFHSTDLLDLTLQPRDCVESFCDLLDYGGLLFAADWQREVAAAGNMETCEALIRLDRKVYADPSIGPKVNSILAKWPCNSPKAKARGCEVAHHAEDLHLRLAIRNGGRSLRDRLRALL